MQKQKSQTARNNADDKAFDEILRKNPAVCDNCYLVNYDVVDLSRYSAWRKNIKQALGVLRHPRGTIEETPRGEFCECGSPSGSAVINRSLSAEEAQNVAENISKTFELLGIVHDRQKLLDETRRLKRDPDRQAREDKDVFAVAVKKSIRQ